MKHRPTTLASGLLATTLLALGGAALAQQPPVENRGSPAATAVEPETLMGLTEVEALLKGKGIRIEELELRGPLVKVEGRDANNWDVEVVVDRRTGEIVSHRFD